MPLDAADVKIVWAPQPGPQHALVTCPFKEIFFGGSRGGGKTDGILGKWASKSWRYGSAFNGIFFRKEMPQADDLVERAKEIYIPIGAEWREQPRMFRMPGGGRVRFRPLENVTDAEKYQGQNLCVAVGTLIVMADGSRRPIEDVGVDEYVATLEGPHRVLARTQPYLAPCVQAQVWNSNGVSMGFQTHPIWHPVLTIAGISRGACEAEDQDRLGIASIAEPISSHTPLIRRIARRLRLGGAARFGEAAEPPRNAGREIPAWFACSEDAQTDCKASSDGTQVSQPPGVWSVPVALHAQTVLSSKIQSRRFLGASSQSRAPDRFWQLCSAPSRAMRTIPTGLKRLVGCVQRYLDLLGATEHARACALLSWRTIPSFPSGCPSGSHSYGGPFRGAGGSALGGTPLPPGAAGLFRNAHQDASGTTRTRSQISEPSWVHPYSGEARHLDEAVTFGKMECRRVGDAWVTDLCVEGANHYISDTGLINKNTDAAVEEAGNYADPKPIDMLFGALRSKAGVPVQLILTANPGGVGQTWIKYRYIDPAPRGMVPLVRKLPNGAEHRYIYIPSKVQDNKILLEHDPDYINRLYLVGSPELVRAWLDGDWSVVAGAFFPEFSIDRHVIAPLSLPAYWQKFRSFDWGSAHPFVVHWWAVSDGELAEFPRGAMICYREWYGAKQDASGNTVPNTGLRLTAEEIADGILKREASDITGTRVMGGVADPSIFSEDGGPSHADRMAARKVFFRAGDNARVARLGAMGGWDQLRARLKGDGERPAIYFFSTCRDTIRTLPAMQHDKSNAEDIDTDAEDHAVDSCFVAGTIIQTARGGVPIESVQVGELAMTRVGYCPVSAVFSNGVRPVFDVSLSNGEHLRGTGNHPIWCEAKGFISLQSLRYGDMMRPCPNLSSSSARPSKSFLAFVITCVATTFSIAASGFIARSGRTTMGDLLEALISTTKIWIRRTISRIIWSVLPLPSMSLTTAGCEPENREPFLPSTRVLRLLNGTVHLQASRGIAGTGSLIAKVRSTVAFLFAAANVAKSSKGSLVRISSAQMPADPHGGVARGETTCHETVSVAAARSSVTNTAPNATVRRNVLGEVNTLAFLQPIFAITAALSLRPKTRARSGAPTVVGEPTIAGKRRVYNLSVEGAEEYFANGVLVHNCRYAAMSRPYTAPLPASADDTERDGYARSWRPNKKRRGSSMAA